MTVDDPKALLRDLFDAAVAAAQADKVLAAHLPEPPAGRTVVVGAGKAAAAMAAALEAAWDGPLEGLVAVPYGHGAPTRAIEVVEAAHPVPDAAGAAAARRMLELVAGLSAQDLVIALISGGGSALLTLPAPGLGLADKQAVNRALLASGAPIGAMNTVRKHLSAIKGGRLAAAAHPARVVTLAISDVPGDDPSAVASGPTVGDPTTRGQARAVLERFGLEVPAAVRAHLARPEAETPKPGDPRLAGAEFRFVATPLMALQAAAARAQAQGVRPVILGDAIEGEAREAAKVLAGIARHVARNDGLGGPPCVLISGGETTVTLGAGEGGRGGRNTELALALAIALDGAPGTFAIACDTDGIDGSSDAAGALVGPDSLARADAKGLDPALHLAAHDSYGWFAGLGDLVVTGPTRTNVNDFRAIVVTGAGKA